MLNFLLNFLILITFGRYLTKNGIKSITIYNLFIAIFSIIYLFYSCYITNNAIIIPISTWFILDGYWISFSLSLDFFTLLMLSMVIVISTVVHIYSFEYMDTDPHFIRFISFLSLFTFFMLILITSSNLIQFFLGWEGVGLCSYLLVNFWFTRISANKSAIKAVVINRIGDCALLLGIIFFFSISNHIEFDLLHVIIPSLELTNSYLISNFFIINEISYFLVEFFQYYQLPFSVINSFDIISFFLFCAAVGKSAQLGLHTWLPDAMEGPTPVSALIHAATMVTAGIFLIIKCSLIIKNSQLVLTLILFFGSFTVLFAGTVALLQNDIKKIIAYSTCSQLGYMFLVCGLNGYIYSFFHLVNHAFFKALLFLTSGIIIHSFFDEQDLRKLGNIINIMPLTFCFFLIGTLAIIGFPFFSGYFSKDFIIFLSSILSTFNISLGFISISYIFYTFVSLAALLTIFYSCKLLYFIFFSRYNGFYFYFYKAHDASILMFCSLLILCLGSIFVGFFLKEFFYDNYLLENILLFSGFDYLFLLEYTPFYIKILPLISVCFFLIFFFIFPIDTIYQLFRSILSLKFNNFLKFFIYKWLIDVIQNMYSFYIYKFQLYNLYFFLDKGILELYGPRGIVLSITSQLKYFFLTFMSVEQTKNSTHQIFSFFQYVLYGIIVLFIFLLLI